jgi:hypothetical protein
MGLLIWGALSDKRLGSVLFSCWNSFTLPYPRHRPHRNAAFNSSSVVACVSVAVIWVGFHRIMFTIP